MTTDGDLVSALLVVGLVVSDYEHDTGLIHVDDQLGQDVVEINEVNNSKKGPLAELMGIVRELAHSTGSMSDRRVHDTFQKCAHITLTAFKGVKELGPVLLDNTEDY